MQKMLKYIFPDYFFTNPSYGRALALAFLYVGVAIAQLFSFERFPQVTAGYGLPGGQVTAVALAIMLPLLEIAALPFLISMLMSHRWRTVSRVAVIIAPAVWLLLALWVVGSPHAAKVNAGIFGDTLITPVGVWMIAFCLLWLWAALLVVRELPARIRR